MKYRQWTIAFVILLMLTIVSADTPQQKPPLLILTTHTGEIQQILPEIKPNWNVYLMNTGRSPLTILNTINHAFEQMHNEHRGGILLTLPMRYAGIALSAAQAAGIDFAPSGTNDHGIYVVYSADKRYAIIITTPCNLHHHASALVSVLNSAKSALKTAEKSSTSTQGSKTPSEKEKSTKNSSYEAENVKILDIRPPKPIRNTIGIFEKNVAISLPPEVKVLKIAGRPYPVKDMGGKHVAIIPKSDVPDYFILQIKGVCAEIVPTTANKANATCSDAKYATLCAWTKNENNVTTVTISAASTFVRHIGYDLYVPKSVARDVNQIEGTYITIVKDPIIRIYLSISDRNVAVRTVRIIDTNSTFAPTGMLSFGSCDAAVTDMNVMHLGGKRYRIIFRIEDQFTPIYANRVIMNVDGQTVIPQRDTDISGYSAEVRLADGAHTITISASINGCGQIRYVKKIYTGVSNMWTLWIVALTAVIAAYIVLKMVLAR
ncbi:MAG: hypothetical protein GXN93_01625 [Candidatus Diapherotrites archaeon]|nr:hypothetical protein [Candidatus Diapherotrites archaeon]